MSFLIPFEYHNGDCIDGMTVVNPVAQGGNGDLYLVRDEAENLLVLKIIRKTDNHDELSGIEQCRAVSSHVPELVPILKTGKLSDGRTYCVMPPADNVAQWPEYKPDTLADRIRQNGRMSPEDALEITGRILSAIKTLHDVGLAHCDIKPENIVFIAGEAKLTDYSLLSETAGYLYGKQDTAKDDSPDQSEIRPPVKTAGTVGFVPPEMFDNPVHYNSKMCDLYAVGKILYCAWTGSDVVSFPSVPRDISLQEIGIIRPLYMRACNVTPAKRFQSADEFISAVLDAKASVSHPFGTHFHGWFKSKRDVLLASLLVLVCVIGLVNILILLRSQSRKQNPDKIVTGLFYEEIIDDDNGKNKGKQNAPPPDPLIVTTDLDVVDANDGVNSLREALDYAQRHGSGATLSFTGGFEIRLSSPLSVTKDVILDAGTSRITLIGPETEPMFQVADSKLTLKNMSLVSDYTGDGGGILDATAFGKMDLFSVTDGGNAKLLWNVSHGFDVNLNDGTHLHRMKVCPPVSGDGSHIRINAGTILEDTTLAGCSGRRGGDYEVRGTLKNASVTEYGDVYVQDGGVCENITVKCASFQPYMEAVSAVGGFVVNSLGGTINGMKLEYGGVYGYGKGILTGTISLGGATIAPVQEDNSIVGNETDIVFDLTERTGESTFSFNYMANLLIYYVPGNKTDTIIDNMNAFSGARSYTVQVRKDQSPGIYRLAAHAAGFSSPVSLTVDNTVCKDVLSIGKSFSMGNKIYKLALGDTNEGDAFYNTSNVLTLTISKTQDNEHE
jgi:serine/threonine protein kinase